MENEILESLAKAPTASTVKIIYKNYHPKSPLLAELQVDCQHLEAVKQMEEQYNQKIQRYIKEYALTDNTNVNLVPKKPNSDLKRIIANKIEKLEKKTERSITEYAIEIYKNKNQS